ncbi:unnamed protein product [Lymnaea stagnalis]|uniref:Uncharacterized protein n=1 Tax=Lymnaea stagnalis TaxID=6523 RepID=A0AAV2GZ60_LYMST
MKNLIVAVFALPLVLSQLSDPTKVCAPDKLQSDVYDFNNNDFGKVAADFTKNLSSVAFVKSGLRALYDLSSLKGYLFASDGSCTSFNLDQTQVVTQCLPANSRQLSNTTTTIGLASSGGLKIVAYEVPVTATVSIRLAFTDSTPAYPVLRQVIGTNSTVSGGVLFFTNPTVTIDPALFVIPVVCPPITIGG